MERRGKGKKEEGRRLSFLKDELIESDWRLELLKGEEDGADGPEVERDLSKREKGRKGGRGGVMAEGKKKEARERGRARNEK